MNQWKLNEEGKPIVPYALQEAFYQIADTEMEKRIQAGLLTNRFSIREFAMQMLAKGYAMCMDESQVKEIEST
jgi:hypothetical protein